MTLKEILHVLADQANALHLHEHIDALPDGPKPKAAKTEGSDT